MRAKLRFEHKVTDDDTDRNLQGRPSRGWSNRMRRVISDNNHNPNPLPINTEREPVHWRIGRLLGINQDGITRYSEDFGEQEVEINNNQTNSLPQSNNQEAGPSNSSNLARRNSFEDIPAEPTPFAESNPLPSESKGKNPELSRHFKNTSVNETNLSSQTNRYFSLPNQKGEESGEDED